MRGAQGAPATGGGFATLVAGTLVTVVFAAGPIAAQRAASQDAGIALADAGQATSDAGVQKDQTDGGVADAGPSNRDQKEQKNVSFDADFGQSFFVPSEAPKTSTELLQLIADLKRTATALATLAKMEPEQSRVRAAEQDLAAAQAEATRALATGEKTRAAGQAFRQIVISEEKQIQSVFAALRMARGQEPDEEAAAHLYERGQKALFGGAQAADVEDRHALEALLKRVETTLAEANAARLESWVRIARLRFSSVRALNEARTLLSRRLPDLERAELRTFSRLFVQSLSLDSAQVATAAWLHLERRRQHLLQLPERFDDGFKVTALLVALGEAFLVLLLAAWVWRVARRNKERFKGWLLSRADSASVARFLDPLVALLLVAAPPAFFALVAGAVGVLLAEEGPQPETLLVVEIVGWVALYWFLRDAVQLLILRLARRHHTMHVRTRLKVLRSVRLTMRYVFAAAVTLVVSGQIVGTVVVTPILRASFALGAVVLVIVLARRWRQEIKAEYLESFSSGRLAPRLNVEKPGPLNFLVLFAALAVIVGQGAIVIVRDFVLEFEHTRRALSFIFRLRMAQKSEAHASKDRGPMPPAILDAFDRGPTTRRSYLVDRFEKVANLVQMVESFPASGNTMVIHGEQGIGRTTWLQQAKEALGKNARVIVLEPKTRITDAAALCAWLGREITGDEAPSLLSLAEHLNSEPRVILIDGLERLFLRHTEGLRAIDALLELFHETRNSTFWGLTCSHIAWRYLEHARDMGAYLDAEHSLEPWTEEQIRSLILRRVNESGVQVSFEELLVKSVEGIESSVQVVANEDGYIRLLCDFAEGNPRIAMHFWLESLLPTEGGVLVRLYDAPTANALEALPDDSRFLLQSILLHGGLTPAQAARSLWLAPDRVKGLLASCWREGICEELESGEVRVTVHWFEATKRFLRRKNLLA